MGIGDLLKNKRLEKGLTQRDIAEAVKVSEGTVSRWESGKIGNMRRDKIQALARALGIDPVVITKAQEGPKGNTHGFKHSYPADPLLRQKANSLILRRLKLVKKLLEPLTIESYEEGDIDNMPDLETEDILLGESDEVQIMQKYRLLSEADKAAVGALIDSLAKKYDTDE